MVPVRATSPVSPHDDARAATEASGARPCPPPEPPPATLGRFVVRRTLGVGGMGSVDEAWDPALNRVVALKRLLPRGDDAARGLLLREAQAMAQVSSPYVVPVYEVGEDGEQVFLAMERVQGRSLAEWIGLAPRDAREVLRALVDAGRGLADAHDAGLVHRDFKPANVIVGDDGRARVLDFGIAHARAAGVEGPADEPSLAGASLGTLGYMSPEHFGGAVTPRSDQWSFGATAWRALFGELPYPRGPLLATLVTISQGPPPPPPPRDDVDPRVTRALARALSPLAAQRFASMRELLAVLEPFAAGDLALDATRFIAQRRRAIGLLAGLAALNLGVIAAHTRLRFDVGVGTALYASSVNLAALALIAWRARRVMLATARNREVLALFAFTLGPVTAHRAYAYATGAGLVDTVRVDALFVAALWGFGGVLMERWLATAAAAMLALTALSWASPHATLPGFAGGVLVCVALAMRAWRDDETSAP